MIGRIGNRNRTIMTSIVKGRGASNPGVGNLSMNGGVTKGDKTPPYKVKSVNATPQFLWYNHVDFE